MKAFRFFAFLGSAFTIAVFCLKSDNDRGLMLSDGGRKSVKIIFRFKVEEASVESCRYIVSSGGDESLVDCRVSDK